MEDYDAIVVRFVAKIQLAENGCYEWTGGLINGYGYFYIGRKRLWAHRLSYILFVDPDLSDNLVVHHLCENRKCVRPTHLEKMGKRAHWSMHWKERQRNRSGPGRPRKWKS